MDYERDVGKTEREFEIDRIRERLERYPDRITLRHVWNRMNQEYKFESPESDLQVIGSVVGGVLGAAGSVALYFLAPELPGITPDNKFGFYAFMAPCATAMGYQIGKLAGLLVGDYRDIQRRRGIREALEAERSSIDDRDGHNQK